MLARIFRQREGGPFAIESHTTHGHEQYPERFPPIECVTVYADHDQPTHSVRLWLWNEEQPE